LARGGFAGGVVVVAERFSAERGAAAAVAVGEDVATVVARLLVVGCWLLDLLVHFGLSPTWMFWCKVFETGTLSPDFRSLLVKCEGPAFGRACLIFLWFYFIKLTITSMPLILKFYVVCFVGVGWFWRVWGA
jgi:hypothetical protein